VIIATEAIKVSFNGLEKKLGIIQNPTLQVIKEAICKAYSFDEAIEPKSIEIIYQSPVYAVLKKSSVELSDENIDLLSHNDFVGLKVEINNAWPYQIQDYTSMSKEPNIIIASSKKEFKKILARRLKSSYRCFRIFDENEGKLKKLPD